MTKYKMCHLCELTKGSSSIQKTTPGIYPLVVTAEERLSSNDYQFDCEAVCVPLVSSTGHGHASLKRIHFQSGKFALGNILCAIISKNENILLTRYLYIYLFIHKDDKLVKLMKGSANVSMSVKDLSNLTIEIPDIETQRMIVDKYEYFINNNLRLIAEQRKKYQQYIAELKTYLLKKALSNCDMVAMNLLFNIEKGCLQSSKYQEGNYNFITAASEWKTNNYYDHECEALIYAVGAEGSLGRVHYVNDKFIASDLCFILTAKAPISYKLYKTIFMENREKMVEELKSGTSKKSINYKSFSKYLIPHISFEKQLELTKVFEKINLVENTIINLQLKEIELKKSYALKIIRSAE